MGIFISNRGRNFQARNLLCLLRNAGFKQNAYQFGRTAVENRDFGAVDIDKKVIDTKTGSRRKQMFYRLYLYAVIAECCSKSRICNRIQSCPDNRIPVGAEKYNPCIPGGRLQLHRRISTGMKTDPVEEDLSLIHISEPTRRTPISYAVFCLK